MSPERADRTVTLVAPRRLSPADLRALPIPLRLNTHTIAGEGAGASPDTMGTLQFSYQFLVRLEQALRDELWEDNLRPHEWHRSPYVVAKLIEAFGLPIIRAVLARLRAVRDLENDATYQEMDDWREYRPYREAAMAAATAGTGFTERQVERAARDVRLLVEGRLMRHHSYLLKRLQRTA